MQKADTMQYVSLIGAALHTHTYTHTFVAVAKVAFFPQRVVENFNKESFIKRFLSLLQYARDKPRILNFSHKHKHSISMCLYCNTLIETVKQCGEL